MNVQSSAIRHSQKVQITHLHLNREIDKSNGGSRHTMKYYSAMKRNTALTNAATWMNLGNMTLSERIRTKKKKLHLLSLPFSEMSRTGKAMLSLCITYMHNLNVEYIMRNAGLEEAQAGIKLYQ